MTTPQRPAPGNRGRIAAVVRRDLQVVRGSKPVVIPMLIVPTLLLVIVPLATVVGARLGATSLVLEDLEGLLDLLPPDVAARVALDPVAGAAELSLVYLLSPLLLIVPLMTASVIAADAIAGERERRTLEGLLLTPLSDRDLFIAKLLVAWLPALVVGVGGGVVYAVVSDLTAYGLIDGLLFPNLVWVLLVLWVGPAVAAISLGVTILVSARVETVQEAFQIAGIVVLPVVGLTVVQAVGVLALSPMLLALAGAGCWVVAWAVLRAGGRAFSRERLGERL